MDFDVQKIRTTIKFLNFFDNLAKRKNHVPKQADSVSVIMSHCIDYLDYTSSTPCPIFDLETCEDDFDITSCLLITTIVTSPCRRFLCAEKEPKVNLNLFVKCVIRFSKVKLS